MTAQKRKFSRGIGWVLAVAMAVGVAVPVRADPAADPSRRQAVTLNAPAGEARPGSVNLQGFVQPLDPGSLSPMGVATSVVTVGGVEAGTLTGLGGAARRPTTSESGLLSHPESGLMGGFAGYRFGNEKETQSGYGVHLQATSDPTAGTEAVRVQPGIDYKKSLSPSWQINSRLFSTYAIDIPAGTSGGRAGLSANEEGSASGFRDVGLSFGLGYAPSESWTVQTQAAYARQLRLDPEATNDGEQAVDQFFGGVIINYKF